MPQISINDPLKAGFNGQPYDDGFIDVISLVNDNPQAKQVSTITVSSAVVSTAYTVTINGVSATYTSASSGDTTTDIAEGLRDALRAEPSLAPIAFSSAANVITCTSRKEGLAFTLSEDSANMTTASVTANAEAAGVPFGAMVVRLADSNGVKRARLVQASDFTGDLRVVTNTAVNSEAYSLTINLDGSSYDVSFTSDGSATQAEISAGLKSAIDGLSLPLTTTVNGDDDLEIQADPGKQFSLTNFSAGGAGDLSEASQTLASFPGEFFLAGRSDAVGGNQQAESDIVDGYPGNFTMAGAREGRWLVPVEKSVDESNGVYVRVSADGSLDFVGGFSDTSGTGKVRLDELYDVRWHKGLSSSQAVLQLR